jgi:hypothetical protein
MERARGREETKNGLLCFFVSWRSCIFPHFRSLDFFTDVVLIFFPPWRMGHPVQTFQWLEHCRADEMPFHRSQRYGLCPKWRLCSCRP